MMKVLYVDDEPDNLITFKMGFRKWFEVIVTSNPEEARQIAQKPEVSVLVTDQRMPGMTGLQLAGKLSKIRPELPVIMLTAYDDRDVMLEAIRLGGVFGYVLKPWDFDELKQVIQNAIQTCHLRQENKELVTRLTRKNEELEKAYAEILQMKKKLEEENVLIKEDLNQFIRPGEIVGKSKALVKVLKQIHQAAETNSSVLLLGETGTGKELFARLVHKLSNRRDNLLVSINCSAIPETLIESELFGHEKGAFSGALNTKHGRFEIANGGTLFLDEIGELPLAVQPKLLRVLQEYEFERVGGNKTIKTDFRLVTATNRNLEDAVGKGRFRDDLFYRLNIFPVEIPPLRERMEDLPLLVRFFVEKLNRKTGKKIDTVPRSTLSILMDYHWPGNIRELSNVVERAHILSEDGKLVVGEWFKPGVNQAQYRTNTVPTLDEVTRKHIVKTLESVGWRVRGDKGAANLLGLNPSTLESRMKKLGIMRP
ncbi:DNA-binding response regulator [Marinilabilia rubra]|uniref:DNA-binding response regulator n=2 Tax=Marinilabilia rubra TaxID=2162893 RepID=A0A2U2BA77_9BACT|nr:DNA-binding response regulator [Marinilabilia rubra]